MPRQQLGIVPFNQIAEEPFWLTVIIVIPNCVDSLLFLFLRWLSHQNLCPKTVDSYSLDRIKVYPVSRHLDVAKIGICFGLHKLIADFVVRTAVRHLAPAYPQEKSNVVPLVGFCKAEPCM